MAYRQTKNERITMLHDLPELEDIPENIYSRHITDSHVPPVESGMHSTPIGHGHDHGHGHNHGHHEVEHVVCSQPTCVDISNHVANCPVCSRLYKTDTTSYMIIIFILAIALIVLLKKVLEA
jgi:hypothetical protein